MAVSVGTMRALLDAIRDRVRAQLSLDADHCAVQPDGQPPAFAGEEYAAVHPAEITLDAPEAEAWTASVGACVTLTAKVGKAPADRHGSGVVADLDGLCDRAEKIAKAVHMSYTVVASANTSLGVGTQPFVEPPRCLGIGRPQRKGPDWLHGRPQQQAAAAAYAVEIRFGLARRYEGLPPADED